MALFSNFLYLLAQNLKLPSLNPSFPAPAAPKEDQFTVSQTGDSVTVKRVSSDEDQSTRTNMVQNADTDYIVFLSHDGKTDKKTLKGL